MKSKTIPWTKIKADYLQGVMPKELAEKYCVDIEVIYNKIGNSEWNAEKIEFNKKIQNKIEKQIQDITGLALARLREVLSDDEVKTGDIINAIGKAIDISGLKSSKQEIEASGFSVVINNKARDVKRD